MVYKFPFVFLVQVPQMLRANLVKSDNMWWDKPRLDYSSWNGKEKKLQGTS